MKYVVYLDTDGNVDGIMRCEEENKIRGDLILFLPDALNYFCLE